MINVGHTLAFPSFTAQSVNGIQELSNLISLGLAMIVLKIDPWISNPGHLKYHVAAPLLSSRSKVMLGNLDGIDETNPSWGLPHLR